METSYLTVAVVLIAVGAVLLVGEFVLPVHGWLVVGGASLMAVAVAVVWYYGSRTEAIATTIGACVGVTAGGWAAFQGWKRLAILRGTDPTAAGGGVTAAIPELSGLDALKGRYGKTLTPMRPAGMVLLDGRRVDAITEGTMLDAGTWVRCVEVKGNRVIVRRSDAAPTDLLADLDPDVLKSPSSPSEQ